MTERTVYRFRLYVAGEGPNSLRAIANLKAFCHSNFGDRHEIEIVDVFEKPEQALENGILLTPALSIVSPNLRRTIVGDLSETDVLSRTMALEKDDAR